MKKNKDNTVVSDAEVVSEVVESSNNSNDGGESAEKMPAPVTMDYDNVYELTDLFLEHLKISLRDVVCEKAVPYYNFAEEHRHSISQADLNEFVKRIDNTFTFGQVGDLMRNIRTKEGQEAYFKLLPTQQHNA